MWLLLAIYKSGMATVRPINGKSWKFMCTYKHMHMQQVDFGRQGDRKVSQLTDRVCDMRQ